MQKTDGLYTIKNAIYQEKITLWHIYKGAVGKRKTISYRAYERAGR